MIFPVITYGYESWTTKKAECQRIDAFELWCWRRLLRVPWTARRSNQSMLKEINHEYSLEGLMLKLKLQYFDHLMQRAKLLEKTLMLRKIEGRKRRGRQRMRCLDGLTDSKDMSLSKHQETGEGQGGKPGMLQSLGSQSQTHPSKPLNNNHNYSCVYRTTNCLFWGNCLKITNLWTCRVVHFWVRICLPMQGAWVRSCSSGRFHTPWGN